MAEAERQRREAAEKERASHSGHVVDLEKRLSYTEETLIAANDFRTAAEKEIAELRAKLANPVALPAKLPDGGYSDGAVRNWCRNEMVSVCAEAILAAGFPVKGGE